MAAPLLVVGGKVLDGRNDSFRLHAKNILLGCLTRQVRVFTEIFKVTAAQRAR